MDEADGMWRMTARLLRPGKPEARREMSAPACDGPAVVRKRMMRRHAKLCLYRLLRDETGLRPPWGALTGVRPSRLFRQLMDEGRGLNEALGYFTGELDVSADRASLVAAVLEAQRGRIVFGDDRAVDVYVGIPFCRTRCLYCSFVSADLSKAGRWVDAYVAALLREIDEGAALLRDLGKRVRCLYVGGGTPTAIGIDRLRTVLQRIRTRWDGDYEFTVEAGRPDSLDGNMLSMIAGCGAGRISVNPQTMNVDTLRRIGRDHTPDDVLRAVELASRLPFDAVNMDLIMGLPGEGPAEAAHTLQTVSRLPVQNLTVHTLALKRASALRETIDRYSLPGAAAVEESIALSRQTAEAIGMRPYYLYRQKYMSGNLENVGWALPGKECLYNIDMMEETHHVLALGAGGVSKRMDFKNSFHARLANPKGVPDYIERIDEFIRRKRAFFESEHPPLPRGRSAVRSDPDA
jgi:oxygen-independent coproporphyrinogen-3 oxidase